LDWVELYKQGRAENPPLRVFNTVVNACEVCGEEELTVKVLDAMKETRSTEGNLITFNIALKRLAKQGNTRACEGIIVGMLQAGIEPSVVTYTTAIAACVADPKQSDVAVEWIKRMKSRLVQPNVITYNTAFASCLDGSVEGTARASKLASDMLADVKKQVDSGIIDQNDYTNIIPNFYTKTLAKNLMKQLDECESDIIDEDTSMSIRAPLSEMVDYLKTDLAKLAEKQKEFVKNDTSQEDVAGDENTIEETDDEDELEYYTAISTHRAAIV
jgi:pentatricopeptide repeat protein